MNALSTTPTTAHTELAFTKGQGTGNDFVLFTDTDAALELSEELVQRLCDRRFGIGADGVIRAVRSGALPEGRAAQEIEPTAEWFMDYRNADGSIAEMCGNGIRVFVQYLLAEGLTELVPGSSLAIATRAGVIDVARTALSVQVDLGRWRLGIDTVTVSVPGLDVPQEAISLNVGNPHLVVKLQSAQQLAELDLSVPPLLTPNPSAGANIEFVVEQDPPIKDGVGRIMMRVYERGVGETLSCGTGVVAAALASRHLIGAGGPNQWQVEVPGGNLAVRMFPTEEGEHVSLSGPAELSFQGKILLS